VGSSVGREGEVRADTFALCSASSGKRLSREELGMKRFDYLEPTSLDEAVALLGHHNGQACLLAGGTDLLVEIKEHIRAPEQVIDIKKIPGMDGFAFDSVKGLRFGALVTARAIEVSPAVRRHYRGLAQAASELGSIQVRNRATIVGNICRASPSADMLPPLIADGASVSIYGPGGQRRVPLEVFFVGPGKTVLRGDEIVTEIDVPPVPARSACVYIKHGRRKAMELATVGVAVSLALDGERCRHVRIVLGAVAPTPIRVRSAEALLEGHSLTESLIETAAAAAMGEARPISNVRGSAAYRREMTRVLTARAIHQARDLILSRERVR
jgi:aerobic carbon-monoxide dehydrogenase medium subunit